MFLTQARRLEVAEEDIRTGTAPLPYLAAPPKQVREAVPLSDFAAVSPGGRAWNWPRA